MSATMAEMYIHVSAYFLSENLNFGCSAQKIGNFTRASFSLRNDA